MDLGNPIETVVHHLLIEGMTCLGHQNVIRSQLVSQLIYVQLVLFDWGSNQQNL